MFRARIYAIIFRDLWRDCRHARFSRFATCSQKSWYIQCNRGAKDAITVYPLMCLRAMSAAEDAPSKSELPGSIRVEFMYENMSRGTAAPY